MRESRRVARIAFPFSFLLPNSTSETPGQQICSFVSCYGAAQFSLPSIKQAMASRVPMLTRATINLRCGGGGRNAGPAEVHFALSPLLVRRHTHTRISAFPADGPPFPSRHSSTLTLTLSLTPWVTKDIIYGYFRTSFVVQLPLNACPRLQGQVLRSCGAKGPETTSRSFVSENEMIKPETMSHSGWERAEVRNSIKDVVLRDVTKHCLLVVTYQSGAGCV